MDIKERRIELGLSQQKLATKLGVRQNTVSSWETGVRRPDITILPKLASVLGCTIDDLFRKDEANGT